MFVLLIKNYPSSFHAKSPCLSHKLFQLNITAGLANNFEYQVNKTVQSHYIYFTYLKFTLLYVSKMHN
jgi:hypothetical protein